MTAVVTAAWQRISDGVDPTVGRGPDRHRAGHRAVLPGARARGPRPTGAARRADRCAGRAAAAQHRAGALAERTRLSREIHDSVGQGLSSITLLLSAAEQDWDRRPAAARDTSPPPASTARDGLDEVRRVVRDLAPAGLARTTRPATPCRAPSAGRRRGPRASPCRCVSHGDPSAVAPAVASALVRSARGALANVVEHAGAPGWSSPSPSSPTRCVLDVRDDGRRLRPRPGPAGRAGDRPGPRAGGHRRPRRRARRPRRGGERPGEGTTVSVRFPLGRRERG